MVSNLSIKIGCVWLALVLTGCGSRIQKLNGFSSAVGFSTLTASPSLYDFGNTTLLALTSSHTITFTNEIVSGLGVGPLTCTGAALVNAVDFQITASTCGTLAAGASCTATVTSQPSARGLIETDLSLTCTDTLGASQTASSLLRVTGVEIVLAVAPLTNSFGNVNVGSSSGNTTFTFTNTGNISATGCSAPSITDTTNFTIVTDNCGTNDLAGSSATCTVIAHANPTSAGAKTATLSRSCTAGGTVSTTANQITATGLAPSLAWSPLTKSFGNINVGLESAVQTFTLTNSGTATATGCSAPTITDPANFTIVTDNCGTNTLASGPTTCTVDVRANPMSAGAKATTLSRACTFGGTVTTTANQITVTGVTDATATVAAVYPVNGAQWNDYVKNYGSGTSVYDRSDTACLGTENGYYQCVHGGEKRKVVVAGFTSCTGLSATDTLGVFDWECVVLGGTATLVSKGVKPGKGLRDLIAASGTAFETNSVTVSKAGCTSPVSATTAAVWWSNTVSALPDNHLGTDSLQILAGASTIYTLTASRDSMGYNVGADKQAIVTLGTSILTPQAAIVNNCDDGGAPNPVGITLLCSPGRKYLWIEVSIDAPIGDSIYIASGYTAGGTDTDFVRVHRTHVMRGDGIATDTMRSSLISEVSVGSTISFGHGLWFWNSDYNTILDSRFMNSTDSTVQMDTDSTGNVFQRVTVSNSTGAGNGNILLTSSSGGNILTQIVTANAQGQGIKVNSGNTNNTLHLVTSVNNNQNGIYTESNTNTFTNLLLANNEKSGFSTGSTAAGNTIAQAASAHNGMNDYETNGLSGTTLFKIDLLKGTTGTCQNLGSGGGNEIDNTCAYGTGLVNTMGTVDLTNSFIGKVTTDDTANTSDASGSALYSLTMDWLNLENLFRAWGQDHAAAFPSLNHRGICTTAETCRIWDWSLSPSDAVIRNINGTFTAGAACPASVSGADATKRITNALGNTYLLNAVEISGDHIGNENGLCESSEACLYAANLGAYQGEGAYSTIPCTFTGGAITSVTMYGYSTTSTSGFTSTIASDFDDGEIDAQGTPASWDRQGESGTVYIGNWSTSGTTYGYFRFQVPTAIPPGATIDTATLNLWGADATYWDASKWLIITGDKTGNAALVSGTENFPGGATQLHTQTTASIRWPAAGGLTWNTATWNQAPDLSTVVQEIVTSQGGIPAGSYIQFWLRGQNIGTNIEAGTEDYSAAGGHPTNVTIHWH